MTQVGHILNAAGISRFGWSGRIILPNGPQPPAGTVGVWARNHHASVVLAAGALKQSDLVRLGAMVYSEARDPANELVYLMLMTPCGRLGGIRTACEMLRAAAEHAAIICYLQEMAYGPALLLANCCQLVFAHPATQIGWLECQSDEGDLDWRGTIDLLEDLAATRPSVPITTYSRLVQSAVTGEHAEALGIVGGLKNSIFVLANIDPEGACR